MTTTETPKDQAADTTADTGDMTLEQLLGQITTVTPAHLDAAAEAIQGRRDELFAKKNSEGLTDEDRAELKGLSTAWGQLESERGRRSEQDAADDEMFGGIPETARQEAAEGEQVEEETTTEGEDPEQVAADEVEQPQAVAASATTAVPRLSIRDIKPTSKPTGGGGSAAPTASIVAGAGSRQERNSEINHAQLLDDIRYAVRANDFGGHGKVVVASVHCDSPEDRRLSSTLSADRNSSVIETAQGPTGDALVAAGGLIAPFQVDYSVDTIGSAERPVQSAFPHYTADRGGIQIRRDIDAFGGTAINASGSWTLANDADADNATPKPIWDVPLLDVIQAQVRAVTQGLRFSNISARFDPEGTAAQVKTVDITHARYGDKLLLADMYAQVTYQTSNAASPLGLTRDLLVAFDRTQAYMRENHRLGSTPTLRTLLPVWVKDAMRADMTRAMHTSNPDWMALTDSVINQWFSNRNINVTWILDGRGAQSGSGTSGTAIPATPDQAYTRQTANSAKVLDFPTSLEFPLFPEGTFVYLDGGQLDVGIIRDQNLVQRNRYVMFEETFEGLYRKGIEAARVVQEIKIRGGSVGAVTPNDLANY